MRVIFGVLSLLLVLAVVAVLARKQFSVSPAIPSAITAAPAGGNAETAEPLPLPAVTPGATPEQQSQQFQQQVRQTMEAAMQEPRPMPEAK